MASNTSRVTLSSWTDNWDDLTELLEDLQPYTPASLNELYPVVQAIAEGKSTTFRVYSDQLKEFAAHMREFKIEVQAQ